jgi:lipopolysaccharide transport system permease protein
VMLGKFTDTPSDGLPYAVFVYGGLVLWTYFAQAISDAARSLIENESLVTKIYFPRIIAPLASVFPALLDLGISLVVIAVFMAAHGLAPGPQLVLLPLVLLSAAALAFGAGAFLAALNVKYRDVRHALPFLVQMGLFASPVLYPSSLATGAFEWIYALNPLVGLLDGFRWCVLGGASPGPEDVVSLVTGVTVIVFGVLYFQRAERRFADLI